MRVAGDSRRLPGLRIFLPVAAVLFQCCATFHDDILDTGTAVRIFPDYAGVTIPPNIAPLNFNILESGREYRVEISAGNSKPLRIRQRSAGIRIPAGDWRRILDENPGGILTVDVLVRNEDKWFRYNRIENHISADPIDTYLAYRLVYAVYLMWRDMGIYQRNLTNFDESPLIENSSSGFGCMNCHSFAARDPSRMLLHFRIVHPGTLIWRDGQLSVVDTRRPYTLSGGVYPSWHPRGTHIAFSVGKLTPRLTTRNDKVVDVADKSSDLIVYDLEHDSVLASPVVSTERRENMPVWSADGLCLYFISAPEAVRGDEESRLHSRYDLMRIGFDVTQNRWGETERVLSSDTTGMSISMPSVSPDGRFMVCSFSDYGYFTIFHRKSDLYLVNLKDRSFRKLELNSNSAESYSAWSSNSRWLVFSSKRLDDVMTRPFIAYIDTNGIAHKPFVLPQEDPELYNRMMANYNRPELITGRIELSPRDIRDLISSAETVKKTGVRPGK